MSAKIIKSALGLLQDDPDNGPAWRELREGVGGDPGMSGEELAVLLDAARRSHERRREAEAVVGLLQIEVESARGTAREAELLAELARVLDEDLLDDERSRAVYERLAELRPDDVMPGEAIDRIGAKRAKWRELFERYVQEAETTGDSSFRSSLLVSAAETVYRYGRDGGPDPLKQIIDLLRDALSVDPKNRRAQTLLERLLTLAGRWDDLAAVLERFGEAAASPDDKLAAWLRLARVLANKLGAPDRAATAYERVLELAPGQAEASTFLAGLYNSRESWDHLVALYEGQLAAGVLRTAEEEFGATLQIGMLHWRMRGRPEAAEPWFEKLRKLEPSNPGMLAYFREWCSARGESARLATILAEAQRAMPEGPERAAVVAEIAKLAEEGANAQKAIEQWRAVLRQDANNKDARAALKRLYRQTASWNALTDLLRQELERQTQQGQEDPAARLATLREIAGIYREHIKSDSAQVTVLTQIVQLDPKDLTSVRDLVRVYESLQRWRDLLTMQSRQADLEPEPQVKAELFRAIARRWLEQFSNVQNAVDAYEKLHAVDRQDSEAIGRLRELYVKRRAYRPLYDLLTEQAESMAAGPERREIWTEMARLAAERLEMGAQAVSLYKRVLEEEPSGASALDALEKQAERDKDFVTVTEVLERRVSLATENAARLGVLQKLGAIYSDRLHDPAKAMTAWRRVLAIQPGHAKALRVLRDSYLAIGDYDGLTELYAQNDDWEGLAEVLSGAADKTGDPALKVDLSFRCATVYVDRLGAPERAFRSYERVLSVRPDDERAASALVPLYEKDEKWGRLPALYEILLKHAREVDPKLALLDRLVEVTGHQLQDRSSAFAWGRKAYELSPEREGALSAFEDVARADGQWPAFVEALTARLSAIEPVTEGPRSARKKKKKSEYADGGRRQEARLLRAKLAEVYALEMGRVDEAVAAYRTLVSEDDGDEHAIQTLDRILREADRPEDLRWLFDLRVERANTALKLDLLAEWAMLEEEAFGAPERAIVLYRRVLQIVPQHGAALRALARLLRAGGDAHGAVEVIAIDRDQREGAERASREIDLARLLLDPLENYGEALAAAERALQLVPNDTRAIEVVERLLPIAETRARSAALLERAYDETGAAGRQAEVLEVLIGTASSRDDRMGLYGRLADVHELELGDASTAFDVIVRAASDFPAELRLWDRLAGLAAKIDRPQALVDAIVAVVPAVGATGLPERVELDLADRVATLFDERLDDIEKARPYLERMLARQPGNERAFQRLKQILTTSEQWDELATLYERVVGATPESLRRAELLAEVALVAEEITGDYPRAIAYYERILELDPLHEQAMRSLETLYAAEKRWQNLALLLERRLQVAVGDDKLDLQKRLGTLLFANLGDAAGALSYLESVLRDAPSSNESRQLVERILDVPELRSRAAIVLEAVYAERDEVQDLVRVLEIHLEFASEPNERRDLLRRVAELRDERLRDDPGALDAFGRLLPLDPEDGRARERMLEIARRMGAHESAAGVLAATAAAAKAPLPRAEVLMDLARLYENQICDMSRADAMYREVLQLAPEDATIALPACAALERIYTASGDSRQLGEILRLEVKLEEDGTARRALRGRLGELCETVLDDPRAAIEAWRARLEDDPADAQALVALDRLYERTQAWRELVDVLRARERHVEADDKAARRTLLVRIATTLADRLTDVDEGIVAYRTVIDDFGADRESLAALAILYEIANRWQDLADTLESDLALADTTVDQLAILARLGDVRHEHLGDVAAAIEAYRRALALDASHPICRAALESLLDDPAARRDAAAILRPLYEVDGLYQRLLKVLEIEAEYAETIDGKLAVIAQASQVAEGPLADATLALSYAARGLREAVAEPELPRWIERAERLAASTGKHSELVELLRSVVGDILDGELQLAVTLRIADIARTRMGDAALAKTYYTRALDVQSDDPRALVALESLFEETGDYASLLSIVKRRVDACESDDERKRLLFKQARLSDEKLGDTRGAIAVYEHIVDDRLDDEAVAALERLYAHAERWEDLVSLYERQIGADVTSDERRAALHHALGDVLEKRMREVDRAFDEYATALTIDSRHPQTVASLEALMARTDCAARAAEMLEPVYLARLDWRRVMSTLEARLGASHDPDERRQLLRRLAKMHEEQEEDYGAALETTAKLLSEEPTDESTWAELERLARVANAEARLADIYAAELTKIASDEPATARLARRTGELFEIQKDVERALSFYRRAYAFDPEANEGTFDAIDRLLRLARRPQDRVRLYRDALDYRTEPAERLRALHTIARIEELELHDDAAAIETYRAGVDVDEGDLSGLEALSRLYTRTERWRDLADLARRRAEQSALPEDEARFRLELANLLFHRLGEPQAGLDELQAVVELLPQGGPGDDHGAPADGGPPRAEAVHALERMLQMPQHKARVIDILRPLYERADDWRRLVEINDERLALATNDGERIAILRESARLWEERGGDLALAFDSTRRAWTLDPEDADSRENLDRLAAATGRWDDLAESYEKAIGKTGGIVKRELLASLAQLHDKKRDDPRRALDCWEALFGLDETEIQPLEEMDALATLLSDWATLVRVLTKKADLLSDDESRAGTWRRIGEAKRDMLEDVEGAVEAYERALELEPTSTSTVESLIELHELRNASSRLVDLYRRRVELCGEGEEDRKFDLLVLSAARFESDLADPRQAIECLTQALVVRPGDGAVLQRLDVLFTRERLWSELLDNLKLQIAISAAGEGSLALRKRVAALYAVELHDPTAALDAYREVLASGFDAEAAAALVGIGETHDELRADAADALEPVLRAAARYEELAGVLEMRLRAQAEPAERARTLRALGEVAEKSLDDVDRAQSALLRAVAEEPQDATLHVDVERLAARTGADGWRRYADALQERAATMFDAEVAGDLLVRLGRISEERLDDPARAAKAYVSAAERVGDGASVLRALDRLFAQLGDGRALADVIERRIAVEAEPSAQADLLHRLAILQIAEFGARTQGLGTLRQAIERVPEHVGSREALETLLDDPLLFDETFDALEFVHRTLGRSEELAKLYERRVQRAQTTHDRTRARLELAEVLEQRVGDPLRAQRAVESAIAEDPADEDALTQIERLAALNGAWARAAESLAAALQASADLVPATRTELWLRLAGWRREKLDDARGAEEAYMRALAIDPESLDVLRALEVLRRAPGRERELVDTLRTRARLETGLATKRELLREAKGLAEDVVRDLSLTEATLRDLIAEDEGDLWALEELTNVRETAGDDSEVVKLLLRRAELSIGTDDATALKHRTAKISDGRAEGSRPGDGALRRNSRSRPGGCPRSRCAARSLRSGQSRQGPGKAPRKAGRRGRYPRAPRRLAPGARSASSRALPGARRRHRDASGDSR